jgi:Zn-finger nucleic acid-binding protein
MQLLCQGCGAPLPPEALRNVVVCEFCGGTEAPKPRVIQSVVERVVVIETAAAANVFHCPRCGGAMDEIRAGVLRVCTKCGGAWVDRGTVERLSRQRDDDLVSAARRGVGLFAPRDRDHRPMIGCPICAAVLERRALGEHGDAYDVCGAHGAFFDHGELKKFVDQETERRAGTIDESDAAAAGLGGWRWPWS